jgi:hypothetical protein
LLLLRAKFTNEPCVSHIIECQHCSALEAGYQGPSVVTDPRRPGKLALPFQRWVQKTVYSQTLLIYAHIRWHLL